MSVVLRGAVGFDTTFWDAQIQALSGTHDAVAFTPQASGQVLVEAHQVVRDLTGTVLADEHVGHRFTNDGGLVQAMELCPLPSCGLNA